MSRYVYWISERTPQGLASAISRATIEDTLSVDGEVRAYVVRTNRIENDHVTMRRVPVADVVHITDRRDDADFVDLLIAHGDPHHVTMPSPAAVPDSAHMPIHVGLLRAGMHRAESHKVLGVERDERGTITTFYVEGVTDPVPARKAVWVRYAEGRS